MPTRPTITSLAAVALIVAGCASDTTSAPTSAGTSGAPGCHGDDAAWQKAITPIACTKNSDCCVIINECTNDAQVVFSQNRMDAKEAWPYCDADCKNCLPASVDVYCVDSACVGYVHEGYTKVVNHCGLDGNDDPTFPGGDNAYKCGG